MSSSPLRARQESQERLVEIIDRSPAVAFVWSNRPGWPVAFVSRGVERWGYGADELVERAAPFRNMVHPEDVQRVEREVRAHLSAGEENFAQDYRILTREGGTRFVLDHTQVRRDATGEVEALEGILLDITPQREAEAALDEVAAERDQERERARAAMLGTVEALMRVVERRDAYTAGHQSRVAAIAGAIAERLGYDEPRLHGLKLGAALHDIGKISVPSEILTKPGRLSPAEYEIVKAHAAVGYELVKDVDFPWPIARIIHEHHERLDGSGYPHGLRGDQIAPEAKVVAVADVYEAMTSHRPYRAALPKEQALSVLREGRGTLFDTDAVDALLALHAAGKI